tara:strand:+ start:796 stop:1680 length:885 start_codon:yes stop_codon:yes gene_type:complete
MKLNLNYITGLLEYEKVENALYVVATPIGNLGDITIRSLKILSCVDLILCEDTRTSKKLTNKFEIKTPLKPFHKHNSGRSIPDIIKRLKIGLSIALISDSGTPIISDPGSDLVNACIASNITVYSLPGPSAVIASLVHSNFSDISFQFRGFFPRQKKEINKVINLLKTVDCPVIFFESPKRILKTLNTVSEKCGNRNITLVRELTKKNEEVFNSSIFDLIQVLGRRRKILGEITLIIEPLKKQNSNNINKREILVLSKRLSEEGLNISEISKIISKDFNISKREVYQLLIKNKY